MNATVQVDRFVDYLEVKRAVDDRSINPRVWESAAQALAARRWPQPLRVLELGCGIGTMLERALEWKLFGTGPMQVEYAGVDASPGLIAAARQRTPGWAGRLGLDLTLDEERDLLQRAGLAVQVRWEAGDVFDFAASPDQAGSYDLLLAHAFLDLVDAQRAVAELLPLLRPRGFLYFTLVFDGLTRLEPEIDSELDSRIERLYHQTMDRRVVAGRPSGHSQTGRRLRRLLPQGGGQILASGDSDWVVIPRRGRYRPGEQQFVGYILDTIEAALRRDAALTPTELDGWLAERRSQLARGELAYRAHQLDYFGAYVPAG